MEEENLCRCCLAPGSHKDLCATYVWLGKKEIYSEMLTECFNIILSSSVNISCKICDSCIKHLRDSMTFKQLVLESEQELLKRKKNLNCIDEKPFRVKLEPKPDSDEDSDDYFLADAAAQEFTVEGIKEEKEPVSKQAEKRTNRRLKKSAGNPSRRWRAESIKSLVVSRLATSINALNLPEVTITPKPPSKSRKVTVKDAIFKERKVSIVWSSRARLDKVKHKENLQTILEYSNATPFKNKTLLGFTCGYCTGSFPDPADLRTHTNTEHAKERPNFKTSFDLTEYNVKLDVSDLNCTLCDEKMDNLNVLKEHLVKIHNKVIHNDIKDHVLQFKLKKGEVYDCAMCSSTYETFKMLKQHMNKHYSNYSCNKCDTAFATKRSLHAHITTHEEGSFKCDYCDKIFPTKAKKQYHEKTKHMGARSISNCPFCNEPFRSYYQRNQHLVKVHNSEAQYKCNVCDKSYVLKSLLMYHIKKSHLMERNCQCTECGFRFFSKKALKAHMVKHTGERIYACEVCNKSYARKYTLREHMRIHTNDRRFKCEVCGMSFVQKCSLKSHLLSNHGISMAASEIVRT